MKHKLRTWSDSDSLHLLHYNLLSALLLGWYFSFVSFSVTVEGKCHLDWYTETICERSELKVCNRRLWLISGLIHTILYKAISLSFFPQKFQCYPEKVFFCIFFLVLPIISHLGSASALHLKLMEPLSDKGSFKVYWKFYQFTYDCWNKCVKFVKMIDSLSYFLD